mgnify:FL=1
MRKLHVNILDKYIIKKFIGTFFFTILIAIVIVIVFDLSEKVDKFVEHNVTMHEIVFDYYGGFIPWILNSFAPLFVFVSAIFFTSKLTQNSEFVAMLSSGISFNRLMVPYMASAAFMCAFSLVLALYIIPPADQKRLEFENKYIKTQMSANNQRNIHYQISPGEFLYVEQFSQWSNTAYKFTLETIGDGEVKSKLSAEAAEWDSTACGWKLKNFYIRDFYGPSETVRYGKTTDTVIALQLKDFYRRQKMVESLSQKDLNDLIAMQKMRGDESVKVALIEKYTRTSTPFSAFVLTIIAVSLSSRKKRGGLGINIGIGLALSFIYILFMRFSQMFVHTGTLPPGLAIWLPNMVFAVVAAVLYRIAPK